MKPSIAGLVVLVLAFPAPAQRIDIQQPQSPPLPAPKWLKIIDQGQNDPRLKGYFTPEGIKVEIVADFPVVTNPVGMAFADDGTLFVMEWRPDYGSTFPEYPETFTYKDGTTRKVATMKKRTKDIVKVLHFNKEKGVYDRADIIIEDELPSSILLHDGWVYLSGRGTVRRYKQSKPGGPYDVKEVIAQGFCGFHHHQVSGMTIGNDGWLYITSGDDDNFVEGSDGSRATVLRTGAVFRCRPDGSQMHTYAIGFRNPYRDVAFDTAYNMFHVDNDNEDGSKFTGCRLMHIPEEGDFGWRLLTGARCCRPDHVRGAVYGELPGKLPPLLKTGRGAPAGLLIYNDTYFPGQYQGLLYYPDVFRKLIRAYRVQPAASSFRAVEEFEFMKSDDPLFRPCQMVVGPDGAIYVCDWRTDHGGAGQLWGDGKHGRIYRLSWAGTDEDPAIALRGMDSWSGYADKSLDDLIELLKSENFTDRERARRELARRGGDEVVKRLREVIADPNLFSAPRIAALGALLSLNNAEIAQATCRQLLVDRDGDLRRLAADGLALYTKAGDRRVQEVLIGSLSDPDPTVRRAVALAIGRINAPGAADALLNLLRFDDGRDVVLTDGLVRALERTGKEGIRQLLDLADSGLDQERNKVVEVYLGLRTPEAAAGLPLLLKNPHLSIDQRVSLVRSFSNYLADPPVSPEPLLDYLTVQSEASEVKQAALEVLGATGVLRTDKGKKWLLKLLEEEPALRPTVLRAIQEARLSEAAPQLIELLRTGDLANPEKQAVVQALAVLGNKAAVPVLKNLVAEGNSPAELMVEGLRALVALDGTAAEEQARTLLDHKRTELRAEAIQVLGLKPAGAMQVGKLFLKGKLERNLLPQVADVLRKHAGSDAEAAKLLTEVMKGGLLLSLDPKEVERVRQLVQSKGSATRGKELYLSSKTLACIRCHRLEGVGGSVGPDLTRTWDTLTVEKIMETLIDPSKEIKEGFQTYTAITTKGLVYNGLKVSQNANEVVLRDAEGRDIRIAAADLEELTPSKLSLMPDNVISQLTFDQFIDLVAFLKDRTAQESLQGMVLEAWAVGPFPADLDMAGPPEKQADPKVTYEGVNPPGKRTWQPLQAGNGGLLDLRPVAGPGATAGYALTYVFSPTAQKVEMGSGGGDLLKIWVDGKTVYEQSAPRPLRPDQDRTTVELKQGWNPVLVKVVSQGRQLGLYLRFSGGQGLRVALKPE